MHTDEVTPEKADDRRFGFGKNWSHYIRLMNEDRISDAVRHLQEMLGVERLDGVRMLDIGSGSGLFSLAATRLGAVVHSFDYDPQSVGATLAMRQRFHLDAGLPEAQWTVEQGSVLDAAYMASLGTFDLVYSWGVLHHTGSQWEAIDLASKAVNDSGTLFIALYNDQGLRSRFWTGVKRLYNGGWVGRLAMCAVFVPVCFVNELAMGLRQHGQLLYRFRHAEERGMSPMHDWLDWIGGYPFEVSTPEQTVDFLVARGFVLRKITTVGGGLGNNQFVFRKA